MLVNLRIVIVTKAGCNRKSVKQCAQILTQRDVALKQARVRLAEPRRLDLCNHIVGAVSGVATPHASQFAIRVIGNRECRRRHFVEHVKNIVGRNTCRAISLDKRSQQINLHRGSLCQFGIDIGTNIGLRELQLRIVIVLLGILQQSATVGIIHEREKLQALATTI